MDLDLRQIEPFEVSLLLDIAKSFTSEKSVNSFNNDIFVTNWENIIKSGLGVVFAAFEDGKIIGTLGALTHNDINSGLKTASEFFWFVNKSHRGSVGKILFKNFMEWADSQDCKIIMMAHFLDSDSKGLDIFYKRHGFRPVETQYIKEV